MTLRGDELVERICEGGSDDDAHELLAEFYRGYPISNLRRLFHSNREDAIKAGAWMISELGQAATPLLDDVPWLLRHHLRYARFFALDAVLVAASVTHGPVIAEAIRLIDDEDDAVRWKAMHFLSRATTHQLRAGVRHLNELTIARLVKWLLDSVSAERASEIIAAIGDEDPLRRRIGTAAAARIAPENRTPLEHAESSSDVEVAGFAREILGRAKHR